jgi:hypothetical protein
MQETPYTAEETERIRSHFLACQSAMQSGEANESLGKCGLPAEYVEFATKITQGVIMRHGLTVPSDAFVIAGLTCGFALGRDFGRIEESERMVGGGE